MLLANGVSTFFINGKPAAINGLRKLRNPWLVVFLVVPFNKIPLFSKDLISFIISFISLIVSVILQPSPAIYYLTLYICLPRKTFLRLPAISVPFLAIPQITHSNCTILQILETCVSVNNNLW